MSTPTVDLFPHLFRGFTTTAHFNEEAIAAVEARLSERAGKTYVRCPMPSLSDFSLAAKSC